ncbi:hypothetical protein OS493_019956 [Desmophyllum pertusum]|uniref:Uncharacterized protein n=1 Tax=Desmophyllum pertusum TaxID=174260 RepID=A0A9W9YR22_9CNID|nr:hypothetical protein OS493_019956 [Desmophyllum pertusum]
MVEVQVRSSVRQCQDLALFAIVEIRRRRNDEWHQAFGHVQGGSVLTHFGVDGTLPDLGRKTHIRWALHLDTNQLSKTSNLNCKNCKEQFENFLDLICIL